jgi:hypothetical protein
VCAEGSASGEGAGKGGGTHGVVRMASEINAPPFTGPELLQQFLDEELPGDQMGGVVTFCIGARDQTLSYSRSLDSLPQTPAAHLVFQRKDGHLSRLARCSNCQTWYPWTQSEEESWCDEQACQCNPRVEMLLCKTCPFYYCGCDHFKSETDKHAEKGGDKDQQWREFRELLPEHSRDKPLTAVVDQLFADASVQDPGILLEGTIWLVPIRSAMGTRVSVRRG